MKIELFKKNSSLLKNRIYSCVPRNFGSGSLGHKYFYLVVFNRRPSTSSYEFTLLMVGTTFVVFAVYLKFYQYRKECEILLSLTEKRVAVFEKWMVAEARRSERQQDINGKIELEKVRQTGMSCYCD